MEYKLHEKYETENAIVRIFAPISLTEKEKQNVINDIAQASYDMALDLLKKNKLRVASM